MQQVSAGLATAIVNAGQAPTATIRAGLGDNGAMVDISDYVLNWSVDRSLSTDVPDQARLAVGYSSAQFTATLAGLAANAANLARISADPRLQDGMFVWSPFSTSSPFHGKQRIGAPIICDVGYAGVPDPGRTRGMSILGFWEVAWQQFVGNLSNGPKVQIAAAQDYWACNTVRLQVSEANLLTATDATTPAGDAYNSAFLAFLTDVTDYALGRGLTVVMNDWAAGAGVEHMPVARTVTFWRVLHDMLLTGRPTDRIVPDIFNEPRPDQLVAAGVDDWPFWHDGGVSTVDSVAYVGMQSLVTQLRGLGITNPLWVETPGYSASAARVPTFPIVDPLGKVTYSLHHPVGPHNRRNWDYQFGAANRAGFPVVFGEWTNFTTATDQTKAWADGYTAVPDFLDYLAAEGIGLGVYALDGARMCTGGYAAPNFTDPTVIRSDYATTTDTGGQGAGWFVWDHFHAQATGGRIRRFTGTISRLETSGAAGTATLTALVTMPTAQVNLPAILADTQLSYTAGGQVFPVRPGLNGTWLIDYLLRQAGIYASPPARPQAILSATMHGSTAAEVGTVQSAQGGDSSTAVDFTFPGLFAGCAAGQSDTVWNTPASINSTADRVVLLEWWQYVDLVSTGRSGYRHGTASIIYNRVAGATPTVDRVDCYVGSRGNCYADASYNNGQTTGQATGPAITATGWHYIAVVLTIHQGGGLIQARFTVDQLTGTVVNIPTVTLIDAARPIDQVEMSNNLPVEAFQVADMSGVPVGYNSYWGGGGAYPDASLNTLQATPVITSPDGGTLDAWTVIQDLAAAEYGTALVDETGHFHFRNRTFFDGNPLTVLTLADDKSLMDVGTQESADGRFDTITTPVTNYTVAALGTVAALQDKRSVRNGQTLKMFLPYTGGIAVNVKLAAVGFNTGRNGGGDSPIAAPPDVTVTPFSQEAFVTIVNRTGISYWIVDNSGNPLLTITGQPVTSNQDQTITSATATVNPQAPAVYTPTTSDWQQDSSTIQTLNDDLLAMLSKENVVLDNTQIIADPRLQLGDPVLLKDNTALHGGIKAFLVGLTDNDDPSSGYVQDVVLRVFDAFGPDSLDQLALDYPTLNALAAAYPTLDAIAADYATKVRV